MEGRQLPSQPHLYDPDPPDAEIGHEYDDADSGHYEALPPLRDEHGYLVIYDNQSQDRGGYLVPDKRLSGTSENLVVYSQRPNTPEDSPMVLSFQNAGYESSLVRIAATQAAYQSYSQTEKGRKYSKEKKQRNYKLKEKRDSKKHPNLKRTLTA